MFPDLQGFHLPDHALCSTLMNQSLVACVFPPGASCQEATDTKQKSTEKERSAAEQFLSVNRVPACNFCGWLFTSFAIFCRRVTWPKILTPGVPDWKGLSICSIACDSHLTALQFQIPWTKNIMCFTSKLNNHADWNNLKLNLVPQFSTFFWFQIVTNL